MAFYVACLVCGTIMAVIGWHIPENPILKPIVALLMAGTAVGLWLLGKH